MPKALERRLRARARKLQQEGKLKKGDIDAYVYGTLRKTGWVPSTQKHNRFVGRLGHARRHLLARRAQASLKRKHGRKHKHKK